MVDVPITEFATLNGQGRLAAVAIGYGFLSCLAGECREAWNEAQERRLAPTAGRTLVGVTVICSTWLLLNLLAVFK